jgi:hypothetical protein
MVISLAWNTTREMPSAGKTIYLVNVVTKLDDMTRIPISYKLR